MLSLAKTIKSIQDELKNLSALRDKKLSTTDNIDEIFEDETTQEIENEDSAESSDDSIQGKT